jgi:transposase-like protein
MREIYTAPSLPAAEALFAEFAEQWRPIYPAMISSWESSWNEFAPFLEFRRGGVAHSSGSIPNEGERPGSSFSFAQP